MYHMSIVYEVGIVNVKVLTRWTVGNHLHQCPEKHKRRTVFSHSLTDGQTDSVEVIHICRPANTGYRINNPHSTY